MLDGALLPEGTTLGSARKVTVLCGFVGGGEEDAIGSSGDVSVAAEAMMVVVGGR